MATRTLRRVNCHLRLLLLSYLVLCYQDPVQTADQRITSSCTTTTDALMGDPANITCLFNMDLKEHSKSFNVYRYGIDKMEETLLKCFWPAFGQIECDRKADGYEFDGNVTDRLIITISRTSVDNIGKFTCNPEPSYPKDIEECYLMLKQRPITVPSVVINDKQKNGAEDLEKEGEGSSNPGGIVAGVTVILVVVAAVIVLVVCRKRVKKLIPWFERKPDKEEGQKDIESGDQLNDTGQPLLGTSSKEMEADQPGPSNITVGTVDENEQTVKNERDGTKETDTEYNDSGYGAGTLKHQNLAPFVEYVTGSRDLHSDIPVSEGRGEYTSFTSHSVANVQDENSKTLPAIERGGHNEEMEIEEINRSTLSTDTRSEMQQNAAERSGGGTTQTAAAANAQPVVAGPGEMLQTAATANEREPQQTAPVPNSETNVHNVGRSSTPRDEEPPALREIKGSTGGEHTGTAGNTQDQAPMPTENDRWGQTAGEVGNQRRGTHVPVTGDASKPMQKTKRDEEHMTEMPQAFRWSPATQTTSSDRDPRPSRNVLFYRNQIKCQPNGAYIEDIHREWSKNPDILEEHHTYIQWLFPTGEKSANNEHAQQLRDHEAKAIREDPVAFERFKRSYEMMLHFYGLELADPVTGEVRRRQYGWQDRFDNLVRNTHNFLRITRILTCLGEMGLEHYKAPFIRHMLLEVMQGNLLKTLDSCGRFWIQTVVDDTQKQELIDLYMSVTSTGSVMFSGHR